MELILWRHAEAEDHAASDDARKLTRRGLRQAKLMAAWLDPRLGAGWTLYSSPAVRALQTAEALGRAPEIRERLGTSCGADDVLATAGWPGSGHDVIVVGHQPTLGQVAARLLGDAGDISMRKGAIWWFATRSRDGGAQTILKAVLNPELLED